MNTLQKTVRLLILPIIGCLLVQGCLAVELYWKYSTSGSDIGSIAVAPDGSSIVAGAGKVLFLAGNGSLISKEPYGQKITQTPDGRYIAAVHYSDVYLFERVTAEPGPLLSLKKLWESSLADRARSCAITDRGDRVVVTTELKGFYVFTQNGTVIGNDDKHQGIAGIAGNGNRIAEISPQGLSTFTKNGRLMKSYDLTITDSPDSILISSDGMEAVYNSAQRISSVNLNNGTLRWSVRASGPVNMLAMTPTARNVVAGTENGNIDLYTNAGNTSWVYRSANSSTGQGIKSVGISPDGTLVAGGSFDGKIILLNAEGNLLWTYQVNDRIWHVAFASDKSLLVAAGKDMIYAFKPSLAKTTPSVFSSPKSTLKTDNPALGAATAPTGTQTAVTPFSTATATRSSLIPRETETEYTVIIRNTPESPLPVFAVIGSLLIVLFLVLRRY